MADPVISVYCPSVRPHFWMMQYYSLLKNDIPFEIIYTGPKKPDFDMSTRRIRYIYSDEDPVFACHKAIGECVGEYVMHASDDLNYTEHALDILVEKAKKRTTDIYGSTTSYAYRIMNPKDGTLKSLNYKWTAKEHSAYFDYQYSQSNKEFKPTITYMGGMLLKSAYCALGGFDRRLRFRQFEVDLVLRIYEAGGQYDFCENAIAEELKFGKRDTGLVLPVNLEENTIFFALWCKDDDKPERYTPYNIKFQTNEEFWNASYGRNKANKLTVLPTRSDVLHPIE